MQWLCQVLRLKGKGLVESGSKRGDLYVRSTASCACVSGSLDVPAQVRLAVDLPQAPQGEKAVIENGLFALTLGCQQALTLRAPGSGVQAQTAATGDCCKSHGLVFASRLQSWKWKMKLE